MIRFRAHYDGQHLTPDEPVDLPTGTPLQVTVEQADGPCDTTAVNLRALFDDVESAAGLTEGPEDWAAEHDHYLFGAPRRSEADGR